MITKNGCTCSREMEPTMRETRKVTMILFVLLLAGGLVWAAVALFGRLGGLGWAEGYLYETEDVLLFVHLTENADENMEMEWSRLEKGLERGVPVLKQMNALYSAELMQDGVLAIQGENGEELGTARLSADELVLSAALRDIAAAETRLLAAKPEEFELKRASFAARIQREAEEKKAEQAREKERVEHAKKAEKVKRLRDDLRENVQYLEKLDFSAEQNGMQEQLASMRTLLGEVKGYAASPSLHQTEIEVMAATVESLELLRAGTEELAAGMRRKTQNMENLVSILETDMLDLTRTWEEIAADVPDAARQEQELSQVKAAASQAVARAKERIAANQGEQEEALRQAEALCREAREILNRVKKQHGL